MTLNAWLLRVLFGVMLLFGNEILLWQDPHRHTLPEWGLLVMGYIAIGAITLDLAVRYRVNDVYLAMLMVCIGALFIGLLLNPTLMLADFPRHLLTRVIGASAFVSLEMWGLLLALTGGYIRRYRRLLIGFALAVGFNGGVWARYAWQLSTWSSAPADIGVMVLLGGGCLEGLSNLETLKKSGLQFFEFFLEYNVNFEQENVVIEMTSQKIEDSPVENKHYYGYLVDADSCLSSICRDHEEIAPELKQKLIESMSVKGLILLLATIANRSDITKRERLLKTKK